MGTALGEEVSRASRKGSEKDETAPGIDDDDAGGVAAAAVSGDTSGEGEISTMENDIAEGTDGVCVRVTQAEGESSLDDGGVSIAGEAALVVRRSGVDGCELSGPVVADVMHEIWSEAPSRIGSSW